MVLLTRLRRMYRGRRSIYATDPDKTQLPTHDDAGGLFSISPLSGMVTVKGSLDYETATSHEIEDEPFRRRSSP